MVARARIGYYKRAGGVRPWLTMVQGLVMWWGGGCGGMLFLDTQEGLMALVLCYGCPGFVSPVVSGSAGDRRAIMTAMTVMIARTRVSNRLGPGNEGLAAGGRSQEMQCKKAGSNQRASQWRVLGDQWFAAMGPRRKQAI